MPATPISEERLGLLDDRGHELVSRVSSATAMDFDDDDPEALRQSLLHSSLDGRPIKTGGHGRLLSWLLPFRRRPRKSGRVLFRRGPSLRRRPLLAILRILRYALYVLLVLVVVVPILAPSYSRPPSHYRELVSRCSGPSAEPGCANPFNEQIFISVSLYDKGGHLASGHWGRSLLELVHLLGDRNVFLSIYENDSGPEGKAALEALKDRLRCAHEIVSEDHVSLDDFPTVTMPDGSQRLKRLTYLSEIRNRALRPLDRPPPAPLPGPLESTAYGNDTAATAAVRSASSASSSSSSRGIRPFDKVLFLNDIAFYPTDAAQLLFSTNVGPDGRARYLAACALDFINAFVFYDLYAQRDFEGYSNGLPVYPFFSGAGRGVSRADMLAQRDAVRVSSCWGGMVAVQARWLQNLNGTRSRQQEDRGVDMVNADEDENGYDDPSLPYPGFGKADHAVIDPAHPHNVSAPVRFRYEPEVFFDACECCLLLADITTVARKEAAAAAAALSSSPSSSSDPASSTAGSGSVSSDDAATQVFVNPYVRVAYNPSTLYWAHAAKRFERILAPIQMLVTPLLGLPTHNPHRTVSEGDGAFMEEIWVNNNHSKNGAGGAPAAAGGRWELVQRQGRNGLFCGVREMQVIRRGKREGDVNWENVRIPGGQTLHFPT